MAQSLCPSPTAATSISTAFRKPNPASLKVWACLKATENACSDKRLHRRSLGLGLAAAVVVGLGIGENGAKAAGRRPPPPPPEEKKDPSVSGVQAKVLASKKRKEAMKQAVAKMRERGKAIDRPAE